MFSLCCVNLDGICVSETMSIDSTLPSPSSLSSPSLGFEGVPGRRRKKRTSIETNVRVALERSFLTVRLQDSRNYLVKEAVLPVRISSGSKDQHLSSSFCPEPEAYL